MERPRKRNTQCIEHVSQLYCVVYNSSHPMGTNIRRTRPCRHNMNHARIQSGHHNSTGGRKRQPLDRILFSSQKRGALLSLQYYLEIGMLVMAREKSRHKADQVPCIGDHASSDDVADHMQLTKNRTTPQNDPHHIKQTLTVEIMPTSMTTSRLQDNFENPTNIMRSAMRGDFCTQATLSLEDTPDNQNHTAQHGLTSIRKQCRPEKQQNRRLLHGELVKGPAVRH